MADDRLRSAVPDGEALRYEGRLRRGGRVGLTDERLLFVRDDGDPPTSVELVGVESVELQDFDWYLAVLSVLLVGFGAVSTTRNPLAGVAFGLVGLASLALTYRKRDRAVVRLHSRAKPVELYPDDASGFYDALDRGLELARARVEDDARPTDPGAGG
jgi:hypothetical protein